MNQRALPLLQVVLLAVPGDEHAQVIDSQGQMALAVLRALGMPTIVGLVQAPVGQGSRNLLKERSAAKKHAAMAFSEQVGRLPAGCLSVPGCSQCWFVGLSVLCLMRWWR